MKINRKKYELACARACMSFEDIVKTGIPRGTLGNAMRGDDIKPKTIGKIAKALNCDVTDILETDN